MKRKMVKNRMYFFCFYYFYYTHSKPWLLCYSFSFTMSKRNINKMLLNWLSLCDEIAIKSRKSFIITSDPIASIQDFLNLTEKDFKIKSNVRKLGCHLSQTSNSGLKLILKMRMKVSKFHQFWSQKLFVVSK